MNRGQIRDEVRVRLSETGTGFYTNAHINQWINDGIDDIALATEVIVTTATVDVVADLNEYLLPDALISIKQVHFKDSNSDWHLLRETTYEDLFEQVPDWEDTSNTADPVDKWYWRQDVLGLYPIPSTTRSAGCRILYTCRPSELTADSQNTGLPSYMDRAVVLYALYRARLKDRDQQGGAAALAEFNAEVNQLARKHNKSRKDHAPRLEPNQAPYRQYYTLPRHKIIRVQSA
jgi:hypothetical protein